MPNYDLIHEWAQKLATLTAPGCQRPEWLSWCEMVEACRSWIASQPEAKQERR